VNCGVLVVCGHQLTDLYSLVKTISNMVVVANSSTNVTVLVV
jgi:hypothetical protein